MNSVLLFYLIRFACELWRRRTLFLSTECFINSSSVVLTVVVCSFNTAVALRTNQFTQVRCPSLEYCNARVLPGALQICNKRAFGTYTASPQFSSRDYGQVQSTLLALHLPLSVCSSLLPHCMHACVKCVSISMSVRFTLFYLLLLLCEEE